jgi:hypothetical protein
MGIKDLIFKEIERVPEQHLPEVLDFIRSLEEGRISKEKIGTAIASESSLRKDWLSPEEDKAWKDL